MQLYEKGRSDLVGLFLDEKKGDAKKRAEDRKAKAEKDALTDKELKTKIRSSRTKNIKQALENLDITATHFADICDVDRSTIRALVDGRVDTMKYSLLKSVADIFNCSVDALADANKKVSMKEKADDSFDYVGMRKKSSRPDALTHGRSVGSKNKKISLDMDAAKNTRVYTSGEDSMTAKEILKELKHLKSNNVYRARKNLDLPRSVFADLCGVNMQCIRVIERETDTKNMRYGILRKIADVFDCSVDDLVKDN